MRKSLKVAGLVLAAVLLAAECALIPSEASAEVITNSAGGGSYYPQGTVVDLCVGTSATTLDHVYAEAGPDAGELGTCGAGYTQLPTVSDPAGYVFSPASTGADVVTVAAPPIQTSGVSGTTVTVSAASSKGYPITGWTVSVSPSAGLDLTISGSGVITLEATATAGTYQVTVTATDSVDTVGSATFDWVVNA